MDGLIENKPKYEQLKEFLIEEIKKRKALSSGPDEEIKMHSEKDLIHKFGVSSTTARRALNDLVNEGYLYRVQGKGSFINLKQTQPAASNNIGIILPKNVNLSDDFFLLGILDGIKQRVEELNLKLSLCKDEDDYVNLASKNQLSGLILIYPSADYKDRVTALAAAGIPTVAVSSYIPGIGMSHVSFDFVHGMQAAMEHLLGLGHKAFGYLTPALNRSSRIDRYRTFTQVLDENAIPINKRWIIEDIKDTQEGGYWGTKKLLSNKELPSAILCFNDLVAYGAIKAIRECEYSIPDDFSLIGFDDLPFSAYTTPPLTTIHTDTKEAGDRSVEILNRLIENPDAGPIEITLPAKLIERESTQKKR